MEGCPASNGPAEAEPRGSARTHALFCYELDIRLNILHTETCLFLIQSTDSRGYSSSFLNFPATLYSLSDVSSAEKLTSVPLRPHCTDESLWRDRTARQEPPCADAFSSLPLATISAPQIHRSPLGSDSCPLPLLPSRFSIKKDDALDEVGAWFPDTFSSIFSQTHGVSTPNASGSCLDGALRPPKSPIIILSAAACAL